MKYLFMRLKKKKYVFNEIKNDIFFFKVYPHLKKKMISLVKNARSGPTRTLNTILNN